MMTTWTEELARALLAPRIKLAAKKRQGNDHARGRNGTESAYMQIRPINLMRRALRHTVVCSVQVARDKTARGEARVLSYLMVSTVLN